MSIEKLNDLKKCLDWAECNMDDEAFEIALTNLKNGYKEAFGDKYELMIQVLVGHCDATLFECLYDEVKGK